MAKKKETVNTAENTNNAKQLKSAGKPPEEQQIDKGLTIEENTVNESTAGS